MSPCNSITMAKFIEIKGTFWNVANLHLILKKETLYLNTRNFKINFL